MALMGEVFQVRIRFLQNNGGRCAVCFYVSGIWDNVTGTGTCDIGKRHKNDKGKERVTEDEP